MVLATGSRAVAPDLSGLDGASWSLATNVLQRAAEPPAPRARVVVHGGDQIAVDAAILLAGAGSKVMVCTDGAELAADLDKGSRRVVARLLQERGVTFTRGALAGVEDGVVVVDGADGEDGIERVACDEVVVSPRLVPERALHDALATAGWAVEAVGDCVSPRRLHDAVHEGHLAGLRAG